MTVSPEYLGLTSRNDLSILTLSRAVDEGARRRSRARRERSIWDPGALATIAGWGVTEEDGDLPDTLQKAQVPITTDAYCESRYSDDDGWDFDPETMVCAGYPEGGVDTCQGDSGGPLFADASGGRRVVGVTSWGNGCAQEGFPGVYARVADTKLRTWVESVRPTAWRRRSTSRPATTTKGKGKSPRTKKGKPLDGRLIAAAPARAGALVRRLARARERLLEQPAEQARRLRAGLLADAECLVDSPLRTVRQARQQEREHEQQDADSGDDDDGHGPVVPPVCAVTVAP